MRALGKNDTWELLPLIEEKLLHVSGFLNQRQCRCSAESYKARLVATGYTQTMDRL